MKLEFEKVLIFVEKYSRESIPVDLSLNITISLPRVAIELQ